MDTERVTIRSVDAGAISGLRETARYNSITLGHAVSEAIEFWLDSLYVDDDEASSGAQEDLSQHTSTIVAT